MRFFVIALVLLAVGAGFVLNSPADAQAPSNCNHRSDC